MLGHPEVALLEVAVRQGLVRDLGRPPVREAVAPRSRGQRVGADLEHVAARDSASPACTCSASRCETPASVSAVNGAAMTAASPGPGTGRGDQGVEAGGEQGVQAVRDGELADVAESGEHAVDRRTTWRSTSERTVSTAYRGTPWAWATIAAAATGGTSDQGASRARIDPRRPAGQGWSSRTGCGRCQGRGAGRPSSGRARPKT